jgi:signal transduction histidine kinase
MAPAAWSRYRDGMPTVMSPVPRVAGRPGRLRAVLAVQPVDALAAAILFAIMAAQLLATFRVVPGQHQATPLAWLLAAALCAPILTHRQFPRASLVVCLAALLAYAAGRYVAFPLLVIIVLTFDITLHGGRTMGLAALIASEVAEPIAVLLQPAKIATGALIVVCEIGILVGWVVADNARVGRERLSLMLAQAEHQQREHQEEARRTVTAERLRIARELHDVVAHSMSVIAVQSAVGGHVMDAQPEVARRALAAIEATSRSALTEMRRLLGVLRQDGEPQGALTPAQGLADLSALASQLQEAGLKVWVQVTGERAALPPSVDLSAYRIVQEALTNVIKHAGAAPASVMVSYAPDAVTVEVTDEGPAWDARAPRSAGPPSGSRPAAQPGPALTGHGLIGMRERVAVFGGDLVAGPRPEGGFVVRARFPLEAVAG